MTRARHIPIAVLLAAAMWLLCVAPVRAQEFRELTGSLTTGYEGLKQNDTTYTSPFVGLGANLQGFWLNPKVLTFGVQPNLTFGHHILGPVSGPGGKGVNAQSTFLSGSVMPLTVSYSFQRYALPTFVSQDGTWPGATTEQRSFGVDWSTRFRKWPTFAVHYRNGRNTVEAPFEVNQRTDVHNRNLELSSTYLIAKWDLEGRFTDNSYRNPYLAGGLDYPDDRSHDRVISFSAQRSLPLRSLFMLDASHQKYDLRTFGQDYGTEYTRIYSRLRSTLTDRVTVNVNAAYLSSLGDFVRRQALTAPSSTQTAPDLYSTSVSTLTTEGGVQVQIATGLMAHGEANKTVSLGSIADSRGIDAYGFGGGLAYSHKLFDGQFSANYSYTNSTTSGLVWQRIGQHSATAFYTRPLPGGFRMTTSGHYNRGSLNYLLIYPSDNYGFSLEISRRLSSGWTLSGRFDLRNFTYTYPAKNTNKTKGFGFSLSSKKLLASFSHNLDSGLAYRFGVGVVPVPTPISNGTGLPPFILTDGNSTFANATYRPFRRLSFVGQWSRYARTLSTGESTNMRSVDVRAEYDFRKLRLSGGYLMHTQESGATLMIPWTGRTFYIQITRTFRVF